MSERRLPQLDGSRAALEAAAQARIISAPDPRSAAWTFRE